MIWGVKDTALSKEVAEASLQYLPDLKLHWIESAGHLVVQEEPDLVNKFMSDFV